MGEKREQSHRREKYRAHLTLLISCYTQQGRFFHIGLVPRRSTLIHRCAAICDPNHSSVILEARGTAVMAAASNFQTFRRPEMPLYEVTRNMLCRNILLLVSYFTKFSFSFIDKELFQFKSLPFATD